MHSWSHWPGRSLCHRLCGYPAWSRECKSTSGSSGAEAGSRTVTGDGSSVGGSGEGLPLVRGANPHFLPEAPPLRVFGLGWGRRWCGSSLLAPGQEGRTEAGSDVGQCSATSFPSPSPIQLYPAGPANVSPAPAPLCGADAGSRTVTGDKLGDRWLGWSRVAHGGSLSFYTYRRPTPCVS